MLILAGKEIRERRGQFARRPSPRDGRIWRYGSARCEWPLIGSRSRSKGLGRKRTSPLSQPRWFARPLEGGTMSCQCLDLAALPSIEPIWSDSTRVQLCSETNHGLSEFELVWRGPEVPTGRTGVLLGGEAAWALLGVCSALQIRPPPRFNCKHRGRGGVIPILHHDGMADPRTPVRTVTAVCIRWGSTRSRMARLDPGVLF